MNDFNFSSKQPENRAAEYKIKSACEQSAVSPWAPAPLLRCLRRMRLHSGFAACSVFGVQFSVNRNRPLLTPFQKPAGCGEGMERFGRGSSVADVVSGAAG